MLGRIAKGSLGLSGVVVGHDFQIDPAAVLADDYAMCGPTAGDMEALQAADAANASAIAGKQDTLGAGSVNRFASIQTAARPSGTLMKKIHRQLR